MFLFFVVRSQGAKPNMLPYIIETIRSRRKTIRISREISCFLVCYDFHFLVSMLKRFEEYDLGLL